MSIRMIGLDLDGTVFNNKHEITPRTRQALKAAIAKGILVLPATGRPESGLPQQFLEIPGVRYALTANGARIIDLQTREVVFEETISWDLALKVIFEMRKWKDCVWETYFNGKVFVDEDEYYFLQPKDMKDTMASYIRKSRNFTKNLTDLIAQEKYGMEKLHMIFKDTSQRDLCLEHLRTLFPQLSITSATSFNVEINSVKCGKGYALIELGKLFGITREEIMVCGDAQNDWNMLKEAGFAVVMANADDETKKLADFITLSNEEDGVAYAIEKFT